MEHHRWKYK